MQQFHKHILSMCKDKGIFVNQLIFDRIKNNNYTKPGIIALDADGTIINMKNGDHWFTLINHLPPKAQARIIARVKLLGRAKETYHQQYLSASSIYEFMLNGWDETDLEQIAKKVQLREGVTEIIRALQIQGFKVVIISHGIKEVLNKVLQYNSISNVDVYANSIVSGVIAKRVTKPTDFIPTFLEMPSIENNPEMFNEFVGSMQVVPNTKGIILHDLLKDYKEKLSFAVGDSEGDIELFTAMNQIGGYTILHLHNDKPNKYINNANDLTVFENIVSHYSVNMIDSSFSPVSEIIKSLTYLY